MLQISIKLPSNLKEIKGIANKVSKAVKSVKSNVEHVATEGVTRVSNASKVLAGKSVK